MNTLALIMTLINPVWCETAVITGEARDLALSVNRMQDDYVVTVRDIKLACSLKENQDSSILHQASEACNHYYREEVMKNYKSRPDLWTCVEKLHKLGIEEELRTRD